MRLLGWIYKNILVQDENSKSSAICKILLLMHSLVVRTAAEKLSYNTPTTLAVTIRSKSRSQNLITDLILFYVPKWEMHTRCTPPMGRNMGLSDFEAAQLLWEPFLPCAFIQPSPELRSRLSSSVLFFASRERVSAQFSSSFFRTLRRSQTGGTALICKFEKQWNHFSSEDLHPLNRIYPSNAHNPHATLSADCGQYFLEIQSISLKYSHFS